MRIDVHSHFVKLQFIEHLLGRAAFPRAVSQGGAYIMECTPDWRLPIVPNILDMDLKLKDMAEMGVDLSVLSHAVPGPEMLEPSEADDWAARINDDLARIIADYPGRFAGFGSLGFGDPGRTIAEAERCVSQLGFKGFQLCSNIKGKPLDSAEFLPVYQRIAELGVPLNMHPTTPLNLNAIDNSGLLVSLGFLYDTSLNTVRMIQAGVFDRAPDLKLIVPHLGGVIPFLAGRLDAYNRPSPHFSDLPALPHPMRDYLKGLSIDSVCYHPEALDYCRRLMGADRILFGTDHPFGNYQLASEMVEQMDCPEDERELIYHGNAERLLGLL